MIKDLLEQLAPLDAQIAALRGNAADEESDMSAITAHASELAELAVEEDETVAGELREKVIGLTRGWKLLYVVYVMREDRIRLVSAREATAAERLLYETQ